MRRVVRVSVSIEFFTELITQSKGEPQYRYHACTKGLPAGAEMVGSSFDPVTMAAYLFFRHESFEPVIEGDVIPELRPEFTTYILPDKAVTND